MRKLISLSIIIFTIIFSSSIAVQAGINIEGIFQKDISSGIISMENNQSDSKAYKLVISKDNQKYYYTIDNASSANFPLQMGNGKYEITLMEKQEDNSYVGIYSETINLNLTDDKPLYLNSIQLINWDKSMKAIIKAKELTKGITDTNKKIQVIYNYIVNSIEYDYNKAENIKSSYIPVIDETLSAKKGICFDYASLFAAMLRSQGIPTKLVMGYTDNLDGYHAWNEVYNGSTGKWVTIDTTYDSQMVAAGAASTMQKNSSQYHGSKEY